MRKLILAAGVLLLLSVVGAVVVYGQEAVAQPVRQDVTVQPLTPTVPRVVTPTATTPVATPTTPVVTPTIPPGATAVPGGILIQPITPTATIVRQATLVTPTATTRGDRGTPQVTATDGTPAATAQPPTQAATQPVVTRPPATPGGLPVTGQDLGPSMPIALIPIGLVVLVLGISLVLYARRSRAPDR